MFRNNLKARLAEGRVPVGHMIWEFGTRGMASMAEAAGLDFVLIDMEHGPFSAAQVADLIAWFRGTSVTPMVRVPMPEYHFIARMLDAGALGIMTPNVRDGATARHIAQSVRYAPAGRRGLGLGGSVSGYEAVDFRSFMDASNEAVTIINQIESQEGLDNLEEIAEAGTDVLWVGQADLSQSLGIPGEFGHPRFKAALAQVVDCARNHGLGAGIQPTDEGQMLEWREAGFNVISYSVDTAVYASALAAGCKAVQDTEDPTA